jgi:hypothetical protein
MEEPLPERGTIFRAAIGIGFYAMAFGASFLVVFLIAISVTALLRLLS